MSWRREPTRDSVSGRKRKRGCGVRWMVRRPCRGRQKPARQNLGPAGGRVRRAADAPLRSRSRSGKSAAPALPAAARRPPSPPGDILAVRPRPETGSRVGLVDASAGGATLGAVHTDLPATVPTTYWHRLPDGRVQCDVCPRACKLGDGQRGLCFVRAGTGDGVVLTTYGRS